MADLEHFQPQEVILGEQGCSMERSFTEETTAETGIQSDEVGASPSLHPVPCEASAVDITDGVTEAPEATDTEKQEAVGTADAREVVKEDPVDAREAGKANESPAPVDKLDSGDLAKATTQDVPDSKSPVPKSKPPASPSSKKKNGSPKKADVPRTPIKSPPSPCQKGRSPVFSPENHRKHMSAFKQREQEKKMSLEARRKAQEAELEAKRLAILKKHEAAEKRVRG
eukprot:sb/3469612/